MNMREEVTFSRNTEAVMIPSGEKVLVPQGAQATITQSLGGSYTVITDRGLMVRISGREVEAIGKTPENVVQAIRRAHGTRSPSEARPRLDVLREAGTPALVASGGHASFLERAADALAAELGAERLVAPGAGHFVPAAPGFGERLERFLASAR